MTGWLLLAALSWPIQGLAQAPAASVPAATTIIPLDPVHTAFGFELRTRWGQRVSGTFPRYDGEVAVLADGRQQVRVRLSTGAVEVAGSTRYTAMARGPRFFDSQRHPQVVFVSEPHSAELARAGGPLRGQLTMRGISRMETFQLLPSQCPRPGRDCDAVAVGTINRGDYGLNDWRFALGELVHFELRLRLQDAARIGAK